MTTSYKILDVLCSYRMGLGGQCGTRADEGYLRFLALVYGHVKANRPVPLCLPAFPFKSPNTQSKVLGRLPDKGEEYALAHLNGLCLAVKDVYEPGAKLVIISDGLVYNAPDLLGVPDRDVWAYGESLRDMCLENGFDQISFARLNQLIHIGHDIKLSEITYVANATRFRSALVNTYSKDDWDPSKEISQSEDTCLTYRGYIKFLQTDLQHVYPVGETRSNKSFKTSIEYIAKQMLKRGQAFAHAVRENFPDHIRLSIHPSTGENKISISTLPTTSSTFTTPWHCAVAFDIDGTLRSGHRAHFDASEEYDLIYENGRPSYYRHKSLSDLVTWEKASVTASPIYPCGMMLIPDGTRKLYIEDIDASKVRALAEHNSPVVLRGFKKTTDRIRYEAKAHELGTPTPWLFGLVLEVKDGGADTRGLNNVLSAEWMPFHFDGMFKTAPTGRLLEDGSEEVRPNPPRFQMFTSVTPSPKDTGFTLFSASARLFRYLPEELPLDYLRKLSWSVTTTSFGAPKLQNLPLILDHPTTGKPILSYHEPWPQNKTKFQATLVDIQGDGVDAEKSAVICAAIDSLLHDRRVVYWHSWEKGDFLVSDNLAMLHTRSDFTAGCDRELWRIHFD
ncbi:Clavaminate synthase-like protein [Cryphonectria parasitica EP155]|uniref:Clavaminate synthase-like protein n=1 Tax=Cryphonectria parasitica (strain ATCC 38755 / EP155) TaxID=660469 RepID=A0A9P4XUV2_CRYP1|nr:Clavaminate synthase-like protein [Cryphonectria parasitica EP155]KAF3761231.1 Clavaminate synthase-like protein [Cryphonectria parasitica EP155]